MDLARGDGHHLGRHLRAALGVDETVDEEEEGKEDAGITCMWRHFTASGEAAS